MNIPYGNKFVEIPSPHLSSIIDYAAARGASDISAMPAAEQGVVI